MTNQRVNGPEEGIDSSHRILALEACHQGHPPALRSQAGLTLIEVLIAVLILGIGLIATLALQGTAKSGNLEAFQRTQAVLMARDFAERMTSNRAADLEDYEGTYDGATVATFPDCLGTAPCSSDQIVDWDRYQFDQAILGASEVRAGRNTGGLINAEGCVEHNNGLVTIVIVWQGISLGKTPTSPISGCGSSVSSSERRMFVYTTFVGEGA